MWKHSQEVDSSQDPDHASTLISDFQILRTMRNLIHTVSDTHSGYADWEALFRMCMSELNFNLTYFEISYMLIYIVFFKTVEIFNKSYSWTNLFFLQYTDQYLSVDLY